MKGAPLFDALTLWRTTVSSKLGGARDCITRKTGFDMFAKKMLVAIRET